jgi:hypothetical protein
MKTRLCFYLFAAATAFAQDHWAFQNRGYYDPILAEPRAARTSVLFPASASSFPYAVNPGRVPCLGHQPGSGDSDSGVCQEQAAGFWIGTGRLRIRAVVSVELPQ